MLLSKIKQPCFFRILEKQKETGNGNEKWFALSLILGNLRRREDIHRYWFFDCQCKRCCDVTEFGTNMSAILCYNCKQGHLLPRDTLDYKSDWVCVSCHATLKYETIDEVLTAIEHQVRTYGSSKRVRLALRVPPVPKTQGPWAETVKEIAHCLRQRQCSKVSCQKCCEMVAHPRHL